MKTINKNSTIALLMLFAFTAVKAQDSNYNQKFKLGFGLNVGYPFEDPYDFNLGADARLQYDLSKIYSLTLTTGFNNLFVEGDDNDLGYIPLKGGFKAFIWDDRFYAMGEAGVAFSVTNDYDKTSFLISPTIGYATKYIDISLRYEYLPDFPVLKNNEIKDGLGQVLVRLAYGFAL